MKEHEATKVETGTRTYYDYRGVRYYTVNKPSTPASWESGSLRSQYQWVYLCLSPRITPFTIDTSIAEITAALRDTRCEHIRKEISVAFDDPKETWQQPNFYVLAGWDYQHYGMNYDMPEEHLQWDAHEAIDALIEAGVIRTNEGGEA